MKWYAVYYTPIKLLHSNGNSNGNGTSIQVSTTFCMKWMQFSLNKMPVGNKIPVQANKIQFHIHISMGNKKRPRERDESRGVDDGKCTFNNDGVQTVLHSATHSTCIVCNSNLMRTICAAVVMVFQSTARHSLTVYVCKMEWQKTAIKIINFCVSFYFFKVFASDRPAERPRIRSM